MCVCVCVCVCVCMFVFVVVVVCFILSFCHADIDVCIYSTCTFLIVKWILMLIIFSAVSSQIITACSAI